MKQALLVAVAVLLVSCGSTTDTPRKTVDDPSTPQNEAVVELTAGEVELLTGSYTPVMGDCDREPTMVTVNVSNNVPYLVAHFPDETVNLESEFVSESPLVFSFVVDEKMTGLFMADGGLTVNLYEGGERLCTMSFTKLPE